MRTQGELLADVEGVGDALGVISDVTAAGLDCGALSCAPPHAVSPNPTRRTAGFMTSLDARGERVRAQPAPFAYSSSVRRRILPSA